MPRIPALLLATVLAGCSLVQNPTQLRGNHVDADQLKDLVPGTSTRVDVVSLLGSPTAKATFDDNTWLYISERTRSRVGQLPGVVSQEVVSMKFDQGGTLREIKRLDEADSQPVTMVSRATPSPGSESSFMQQLLGNVGKFSAGGATASKSGGSGASFGQ